MAKAIQFHFYTKLICFNEKNFVTLGKERTRTTSLDSSNPSKFESPPKPKRVCYFWKKDEEKEETVNAEEAQRTTEYIEIKDLKNEGSM